MTYVSNPEQHCKGATFSASPPFEVVPNTSSRWTAVILSLDFLGDRIGMLQYWLVRTTCCCDRKKNKSSPKKPEKPEKPEISSENSKLLVMQHAFSLCEICGHSFAIAYKSTWGIRINVNYTTLKFPLQVRPNSNNSHKSELCVCVCVSKLNVPLGCNKSKIVYERN